MEKMIKGLNVHRPGSGVIQEIAALDPSWVRYDITPVASVTQTLGQLDLLNAAGFRVLANVSDPMGELDYNAWVRYIDSAIDCIGPLVHAWGFINEPNNTRFWRRGFNEWARYVRYAHEQVRIMQPRAKLTGPNLMDHNRVEDWLRFAMQHVDYDKVAMHFYPRKCRVSELERFLHAKPRWYTPCVRPGIRHIVDEYRPGLPIWIAETGARMSEFSAQDISDYMWRVYHLDVEGAAPFSKTPEAVFWYHVKDDPRYPDRDWGLLDAHGGRKEPFYAFQDIP